MQMVSVTSAQEGIQKAKELLYEKVDTETLLCLSGGNTPMPLYEVLAREKKIHPAAVVLVDERYGYPMHPESNEKKLSDSGFLAYLKEEKIQFFPMLKEGFAEETVATGYDAMLHKLFGSFTNRIAVMGIGDDGHTAGIAPNREDFTNPIFEKDPSILVDTFHDPFGPYGRRVTMTFTALMLMTHLIVLAFGAEKKQGVRLALSEGSEIEVPGRFFMRDDISLKTTFITDQEYE